MSDILQQIHAQYESERQRLALEEQQQRRLVEQQAQEAEDALRGQSSDIESGGEAAKGAVRRREAKEQRKRDLPITRPQPTGAKETIAEIERVKGEAQSKIAEGRRQVAEAKEKNLAAIAQTGQQARAELDRSYNESLAEATAFVTENIQLPTGEYVNKAAFEQLANDTKDKLTQLGVAGFNTWLESQQTSLDKYKTEGGYDIAGYMRDHPGVNTADLVAIGFSQDDITNAVAQNSDLANFESTLQHSNPALYKIYTEQGMDAYNAEVNRLKVIADKYTVPTSTGVIINGQVAEAPTTGFNLPAALKDNVPTPTLLSLGITQAQINQVQSAEGTLSDLEPYQSSMLDKIPKAIRPILGPTLVTALSKSVMYDLPQFLEDHPSYDTAKLVAVGFTQDSIKAAQDFNNQDWKKETPGEDLFNAIKDAINEGQLVYESQSEQKEILNNPSMALWTKEWRDYAKENPSMQELAAGISTIPAEYATPSLSWAAFRQQFLQARADGGYSKKELDVLAEMEYTRLYGQGALAGSSATQIATNLFSPARVLYPEVTLKDISGIEWGVGAAQVVFLGVGGIAAVAPKVFASVAARAIGLGLQAAATGVFFTETVVDWAKMTPLERGISLGIDLVLIAPFIKSGTRWLKAKIAPAQAATEALLKQESAFSLELESALKKTYGDDFAQKYMAVDAAQADYIRALAEVKRLDGMTFINSEVKIASLSRVELENLAKMLDMSVKDLQQLRTIKLSGDQVKVRAITSAEANADATARTLEQRARNYVQATKGAAGFDSPAVAKMMDDLPKEVVRNTRAAVESLSVQSPKAVIRALQEKLAQAEATLKAAQVKFPTNPSKWSDLLVEVAMAQTKLEQALRGSVMGIYEELLKARSALSKATTSGAKIRLQAQVYELQDKLAQAIRTMETELKAIPRIYTDKDGVIRYGYSTDVPGSGGGGRGGVAVAAPPSRLTALDRELMQKGLLPKIKGGGIKTAIREATQLAPAVVVAKTITVDYGLSGAEVTKIAPEIQEGIQETMRPFTKSSPEVISEVERVLKNAVDKAVELETSGKTAPEIKLAVNAQVESQLRTSTAPAVKPQVKPMTEPLVRTALKVATLIKLATTTKTTLRLPITVKLPGGTSHDMTQEELKGAYAWKQGWCYKMIYPPYQNIVNTRQPIPGVPVLKGPRSAYMSIIKKGGQVPRTLARDMGIMDIIITRRGGKPSLSFRPDVNQVTVLTSPGRHPFRPTVTRSITWESKTPSPFDSGKMPPEIAALGSSKMPPEIAAAIGSVKATIGPDGIPRVRGKRL